MSAKQRNATKTTASFSKREKWNEKAGEAYYHEGMAALGSGDLATAVT
jgi:hypothetical protein